MTKIIAMSDTHTLHDKLVVPECDIVLHSGDALSYGDHTEFKKFIKWFDSLPANDLIYTPGNHDWHPYRNLELAKKECSDRGIKLLTEEEIVVNGLRIYGTAFTPEFCGWAFMRPDHEAESPDGEEGLGKYFDQIPNGLDILISHGPPYGYLDKAPRGGNVGSKELLKAIMRTKPKLVLCGHIHCAQLQGDGAGN